MKSGLLYVRLAIWILAGMAFSGGLSCRSVGPIMDLGTQVAVGTGTISAEEGESIRRGTGAVISATETFTPEQEHFIGRSVTATILDQYPALDNPALNTYLNLLGQALAQFSDRPETFGGYRFLALDSDEINAFAAPGGFILITRGMLRTIRNEDELAAILAHEIAHVQKGHGLRAIRGNRLTSAATLLAMESARHLGGKELAELTGVFEDSLNDISSALIGNGYARAYEREADSATLTILTRANYPPQALISALERIEVAQKTQASAKGWARTHPPPADRIREAQRALRKVPRPLSPPVRQTRFDQAVATL